jgi:hypothetical protein
MKDMQDVRMPSQILREERAFFQTLGTEIGIQKNRIFHGVVGGRLVPLEIIFQGPEQRNNFGKGHHISFQRYCSRVTAISLTRKALILNREQNKRRFRVDSGEVERRVLVYIIGGRSYLATWVNKSWSL